MCPVYVSGETAISVQYSVNPSNAELIPIYHLLVLLGDLTLRRLMSYIYGAPIVDVSRSHTTTQHSR